MVLLSRDKAWYELGQGRLDGQMDGWTDAGGCDAKILATGHTTTLTLQHILYTVLPILTFYSTLFCRFFSFSSTFSVLPTPNLITNASFPLQEGWVELN